MNQIFALIRVFSYLSILTVGGGLAAFPEMKVLTVDVHKWLTFPQLIHLYSMGQIAPGPNMMMIVSIGEWAAGIPRRYCRPDRFLRAHGTARVLRRPTVGEVGKMAMEKFDSARTLSRRYRVAPGGLFEFSQRSGDRLGYASHRGRGAVGLTSLEDQSCVSCSGGCNCRWLGVLSSVIVGNGFANCVTRR